MVKQTTNNLLISGDWGTSSFRLFLVKPGSGEILATIISDKGTQSIYDLCTSDAAPQREVVFMEVLRDHLSQLAQEAGQPLDGIPVLLSGMVGSSIGWVELPYAELPFSTDGKSLVTKTIDSSKEFNHSVTLISGVAKGHEDIMRGEETQLIGMVSQVKSPDSWYVFPGTHSKHVLVNDGKVTDFRTFMTGEVYGIVKRQSILKASLVDNGDLDREAFLKGVKLGSQKPLLQALFSLRAEQVTSQVRLSSDQLSGLLIGHELTGFTKNTLPIQVCGSNTLCSRYRLALDFLGVKMTDLLTDSQLEGAVPMAHIKIFKHLKIS